MLLKAGEGKSAVRQTYGGSSSPTMTLFSLSIDGYDLIMGLFAIVASIFIITGSLVLTVGSPVPRSTLTRWLPINHMSM
jgi:hypothetical protein